jgi:hypothetical protein
MRSWTGSLPARPEPARRACPCPVADCCRGEIPMSPYLPSGEYVCICGAAKLWLSWDSYTDAPFRRPRLRNLDETAAIV